jgi:hypothetical protein
LTPNKRKVEIEKKIIIDRPKRDEVRGSCKGVETPLENYETQKVFLDEKCSLVN